MNIVESVVWEAGRVERRIEPAAGSLYAPRRVKTPLVLRTLDKLVGLGHGHDAALGGEWQHKLEQVEAAVSVAAAGAASTPDSRAHTVAELTKRRERWARW